MPSRTDTAGHTKAFDYPVWEHWGWGVGASRNAAPPFFHIMLIDYAQSNEGDTPLV